MSNKNTAFDFKYKMANIKIKNALISTGIVFMLSACTVFSGRETAGEYLDDASITASIKKEILKDPMLRTFQIHVETLKNHVQLSGFVDSAGEVARADKIARNVKGVQGVKNSLIARKPR